MTLSSEETLQPLIGQVGGASVHKQPLLTLDPDYVLKPLLADHRGVREIAFYESMATVTKDGWKAYRNLLRGSDQDRPIPQSWLGRIGDWLDTVAVFGAFVCHDPMVMKLEEELDAAKRRLRATLRKEADLLAKLGNFTPPYYGVWGQEDFDPSLPYGIADGAHLLLQNLTINYAQPCVMDLKLGTQTYEPNAPPAKRERERSKCSSQVDVGFRIVGMRVYDPHHPDADETGFRFWDKQYGRSLASEEQVKEALRTFFTVRNTTTSDPAPMTVAEPSLNGEDENKEQADTTTVETENDTTNSEAAATSSNSLAEPDNDSTGTEVGDVPASPPVPVEPTLRLKALSSLLLQVRAIRRWFEENDSFTFYASSILIVYEGDPAAAADVTAMKMIDFGRVRRSTKLDTGYQKGLRTLKHLLADLLDEEEELLGKLR